MPIKRYTPEQIATMLWQAEIELGNGKSAGEVCRGRGTSEQSHYRRRR